MALQSVYLEKQKFNQPWITAVTFTALVLGVVLSFITFFSIASNITASIPLISGVCVFLLFRSMSLQTTIDDKSISYLFSPFQSKRRFINKEDISQISIVTFDPIREYGGWGIRFGKSGKAYTVSGIYGINIILRDKKRLMIGTGRPKEVYSYLIDHHYNPTGQQP